MSVWDDPEMRIASDYVSFNEVGDTVTGVVTGVYAHRFDDGKVVPKIMLDTAEELARKMRKLRIARGSLDFDLPEGEVQFDENGQPTSVIPKVRHFAHQLIEEFMIAANEAEKASNITVVDVKAVGAFGRLTLAGREGDVEEAAAAGGSVLPVLGNHEVNALLNAPKHGNGWFFDRDHERAAGGRGGRARRLVARRRASGRPQLIPC